MRQSYLFLQGPCTPFFDRLAKRLEEDGHSIHRINFCTGDALYWHHQGVSHFRGKANQFQAFLDQVYQNFNITDQIVFGDRRPLHHRAVQHAKSYGIRTHVFEEGYFRPSWITLERGGVNAHSLLPRDPQWYKATDDKLKASNTIMRFHSSFYIRAMHDIAYHVAGILNPLLFPHYQTHAPTSAAFEYIGYMKRFSLLRMYRQREKKRMDTFIHTHQPYFVLPLQLNSDAQIRDHSDFLHMGEVIEYVVQSFAKHAPSHTHLVMKNHPLDTGFMPYTKIISEHANAYGLQGRIHFFDDGNLNKLFEHASGVITVNSTSGIVALEHGIPTLTLSNPIYNIPGLTSTLSLDAFWTNPTKPDREFFAQFKRVVLHTTQINGGFYCADGIALAIENAIPILTAPQSPLEVLL